MNAGPQVRFGSPTSDLAVSSAVGIDLGGTQIKAVLVSSEGAVLQREARPTDDIGDSSRSWAETIRALAQEFGPDLPLGLSAPGLAATDRRSIAFMPERLKGLEKLDWTDFFHRSQLVPVINDAHASLHGEAWIGAARGLRDCLMLTLGTGVGGAIMCDGRLLRGHLGRAGHIGHLSVDLEGVTSIVGMPGALECFIGNYNIAERTGGRFTTTHELVAASRAGDPTAQTLWLRSIQALACAISSTINLLDPEAVIIGGGIAQAGDALFQPLAEQLAEIEWRPAGRAVRMIPAMLGEWAGAIGAAAEAMLAWSSAHPRS